MTYDQIYNMMKHVHWLMFWSDKIKVSSDPSYMHGPPESYFNMAKNMHDHVIEDIESIKLEENNAINDIESLTNRAIYLKQKLACLSYNEAVSSLIDIDDKIYELMYDANSELSEIFIKLKEKYNKTSSNNQQIALIEKA